MARLIPIEEMESRIGGRWSPVKLYKYRGRWHSAETIEGIRRCQKEYQQAHKEELKEYARNRYRGSAKARKAQADTQRRVWAKKRELNPVSAHLQRKKYECNHKGVSFNLTEDWFIAHFSQGCEISGLDMDFIKGSPWHVEIDRVKVGGPYTMDNCRLVCAVFNRARMGYDDAEILKFCRATVETQDGR